ncbi:MAG: cyclic nucleotide-binding domain-containing protein [Proteobacteria bacterium]|nr:cyclic nucleotide-binding domain-containing protein [Pseudomonadota bacterium]
MDVTILKKVPLFDTLTEDELSEVLRLSKKEEHKSGDKIFAEGDSGDRLYIIDTGAVRISKNIPGIGEEALCVLNAGDYFGEMALIDNAPRSADALSHEDVCLLAVSKADLEALMEKNKELAYKLLWKFVETLSKRLRETNDKIRTFFAMSGGF